MNRFLKKKYDIEDEDVSGNEITENGESDFSDQDKCEDSDWLVKMSSTYWFADILNIHAWTF